MPVARKPFWKSPAYKEQKRAYFRSEAGTEARRRYESSRGGRAAINRYRTSKKGQAAIARYRTSAKGKATTKARLERQETKDTWARYAKSPKGREIRAKYKKSNTLRNMLGKNFGKSEIAARMEMARGMNSEEIETIIDILRKCGLQRRQGFNDVNVAGIRRQLLGQKRFVESERVEAFIASVINLLVETAHRLR